MLAVSGVLAPQEQQHSTQRTFRQHLLHAPSQVILMPNGCMCCRVRGDLVAALRRLIVGVTGQSTTEQASSSQAGLVPNQEGSSEADPAEAGGRQGGGGDATGRTAGAASLDGVIIECSGLDELAPILQVGSARTDTKESTVSNTCALHIRLCLLSAKATLISFQALLSTVPGTYCFSLSADFFRGPLRARAHAS